MSQSENQGKKVRLSWSAISFIEAPSSRVLKFSVLSLIGASLFCLALSFFVKIDVSVLANGETDSLGGVTDAVTQIAGQISAMPFPEGSHVRKDEIIAWLKVDGTTEDKVASLLPKLESHVSEVSQGKLPNADLNIDLSYLTGSSLKQPLVDAQKNLSTLYDAKTRSAQNADRQIAPLERRRSIVLEQLAFIARSPLKNYLLMQKESLQNESDKIEQQIVAIRSEASNRIFEAQNNALQSLRLAVIAVQEFIYRHQVRSPIDGQIARLYASPGAFTTEHQAIASIIPVNSPIVAKVYVSSQDVAKVHAGNTCRINIDAFPAYKYGYFSGTVLGIDEVKTDQHSVSQTGYIARISIDSAPLSRRPAFIAEDREAVRLTPGMKTEVHIVSKRASLANLAVDKILGIDR